MNKQKLTEQTSKRVSEQTSEQVEPLFINVKVGDNVYVYNHGNFEKKPVTFVHQKDEYFNFCFSISKNEDKSRDDYNYNEYGERIISDDDQDTSYGKMVFWQPIKFPVRQKRWIIKEVLPWAILNKLNGKILANYESEEDAEAELMSDNIIFDRDNLCIVKLKGQYTVKE